MDTLIIFVAKYVIFLIILIGAAYILMQPRDQWKKMAIVALPSLALAYSLLKLSSMLVNDPRPFVVEHVQPLFAHSVDNGFPSDHTTLGMTIAAIIFVFNRKLGIGLGVLALLVGCARVLAHVHHPIDIVGGAAIGIISVTIMYLAVQKFQSQEKVASPAQPEI